MLAGREVWFGTMISRLEAESLPGERMGHACLRLRQRARCGWKAGKMRLGYR